MANYNSVEEIFAADINNMEVLINNVAYDDNFYIAPGADWIKFNNNIATSIWVGGNTFFGFGTNSEHLIVNRRDTKMWYLYREEGTLFNYYRFLKFRWRGYSHYSVTDNASLMQYDVILWENGYISLHMVTIPTSNYNGTFTLTSSSALSYTKPTITNPDVTFIPQNENNTQFIVAYEMIDLPVPYERKYLLRSNNIIYTIANEELVPLEEQEIDFSLFQIYGLEEKPDDSFLLQLIDPEILFWQDSTEYDVPKFKIDVTGVPPVPQVVISSTQDMSDSTILGIEGVTATCSDDVLFAISFDDGAAWKAYDGQKWITLNLNHTGMNKATIENIDLEAWREVQTSNYYKFRFILPSTESYLTSLVVDYIN